MTSWSYMVSTPDPKVPERPHTGPGHATINPSSFGVRASGTSADARPVDGRCWGSRRGWQEVSDPEGLSASAGGVAVGLTNALVLDEAYDHAMALAGSADDEVEVLLQRDRQLERQELCAVASDK